MSGNIGNTWLAGDDVIPLIERRQQDGVEVDSPDAVIGLLEADELIDHRIREVQELVPKAALRSIVVVVAVAILSLLLAQRWKSRSAMVTPLLVGAAVGIALAVDAIRASGYVAPYSFAGAWSLCLAFFIAGLPMLPFQRLRRGGLIAVLTGMSVLASFYLVVLPAKVLGLTNWKG